MSSLLSFTEFRADAFKTGILSFYKSLQVKRITPVIHINEVHSNPVALTVI